ncbi:MAG: Fungal specific transcription factor [Piccolia ochrophora]|nr:MAG: Fungal specific transcription factor [Piccolia ochrophora]
MPVPSAPASSAASASPEDARVQVQRPAREDDGIPGSRVPSKRSREEHDAVDAQCEAPSSSSPPPPRTGPPTSPTAKGPRASSPPASIPASGVASFRNVSACNRCRLRKNRCDQRLPVCASCEKAGVSCVGYDAITKKEIPRRRDYVYYLESRISRLEDLLRSNNINYPSVEQFNLGSPLQKGFKSKATDDRSSAIGTASDGQDKSNAGHAVLAEQSNGSEMEAEADRVNRLVSKVGMVSVQGASDNRFLGSTSGISFARTVFAAVKSSISGGSSERGGVRPFNAAPAGMSSGNTMRDSFFGLHAKPTLRQAPFPDQALGRKLVHLYFEYANSQIPILHQGEFMALFDRAYASDEKDRTTRELYMLNIVFAIGAGVFLGGATQEAQTGTAAVPTTDCLPTSPKEPLRASEKQHQPEEYHASAVIHLESFLASTPAADRPDGFGAGLEELQAVLLLAGFALLRPVAPGLWYIVGVAVRLGVDLGLHSEGGGCGEASKEAPGLATRSVDPKEKGRREWFPSMLDDVYITPAGFRTPPVTDRIHGPDLETKRISHHYFLLRLLQSEILQVLQHQQSRQAQADSGTHKGTPVCTPSGNHFSSLETWRADMDRRLWEWKESSPHQEDLKVKFSVQFLELNYWQAVIMLYRPSLSVPPTLAEELNSTDEVSSPTLLKVNNRENEEEVFMKVACAGIRVLRIYRQLHRRQLVNYTYLATHHLFMAGISFLYAIWHSAAVRSRLTMDDVDFTILAATSVLGDLMEKCPPAEACRDAFERMSRATVQMCLSTTGFGSQAVRQGPAGPPSRMLSTQTHTTETKGPGDQALNPGFSPRLAPTLNPASAGRPAPRFDMDLRDLFPDDSADSPLFRRDMGVDPSQSESNSFPPKSPPNIPTYNAEAPAGGSLPPSTWRGLGTGPPSAPSATLPLQHEPMQPFETASHDFAGNPYAEVDVGATDPWRGGSGNGYVMSSIDFGLGSGTEMDHDWSDVSQLDLFDGFFFGNAGGP